VRLPSARQQPGGVCFREGALGQGVLYEVLLNMASYEAAYLVCVKNNLYLNTHSSAETAGD
jgi:hypothetical protein